MRAVAGQGGDYIPLFFVMSVKSTGLYTRFQAFVVCFVFLFVVCFLFLFFYLFLY